VGENEFGGDELALALLADDDVDGSRGDVDWGGDVVDESLGAVDVAPPLFGNCDGGDGLPLDEV
jgi:hypothetical protein